MKKRHLLPILIFILAASLFQPLFPQDSQKSKTASPSFNEYQFVARGKMSGQRRARPDQIVRMDNNGEILLACIKPQTTDQLKAIGIIFFQSQLELLIDWNLLVFNRKDNTYKTTIHIYGPEKASAIRSHVHSAVLRLSSVLNTDLLSLKSFLEKTHQEKSLFSILYAYILHDYSMRQFGPEIYQKPQLTADFPFWNGFAWAIYPIKKFNIGVTALPAKDNKVFLVSSPAVSRLGFQQLLSFVKDVSVDDKVDDPELFKTCSAFGLCDDQGELTIPILEGEWATKLENMAKQVYAQTVELAESLEMKEILSISTQAHATMFLHYELRYAVLTLLLETGFMKAPIDFENADNNAPSDNGNLVFVVKQNK